MSVRDLIESAMNRQATRFQDTLRSLLDQKMEDAISVKAAEVSEAYSRSNIQEISRELLSRYVKGAAKSAYSLGGVEMMHLRRSQEPGADRKRSIANADVIRHKANNRLKGINRAVGRLTYEQNISEISAKKVSDAAYSSYHRAFMSGADNDAVDHAHLRGRLAKRAASLPRGSDKRKHFLGLSRKLRNEESLGEHWSWNPPKKSGPRAWNKDVKSRSSSSSSSGRGDSGDTSNKVHSVRPIHRFVVDREHDNPRLRSRNMAMVHSRIDGKWHLHRDKPTGLHDVGQAGWHNHEDGIKWARASWKSGHNHHVFEDDTSTVVSEVSNNWVTKKLDGAYDKVKDRNPYTDRKADAVIGRIRAIHGYRHAVKGSDKAKQNKGFARSARAAYRD